MVLAALTAPRAIAVIGASDNPEKIGGRPLAFLNRAGFGGAILPVNPRGGTIQGHAALTAVEDLPDGVDLAVIALPGALVVEAVAAAARRGVKLGLIFSSDLDQEAAARLAAIRRDTGIRLLGPNSLGCFSTGSGAFATFATALDGAWPRSGPIAIVSQSGAFGSYLYAMTDLAGGGISHLITTGNELDVDLADVLTALADDKETAVVVVAFEGLRDGKKLMRAIAALRRAGTPVIAMKSGRSEAGQRAAATHTGALAGEDRVLDAALAQAGALRVATMREAADLAAALALGIRMPGRRLGVVTTSGGVGVLISDYAEDAGLTLPPLPEALRKDIRGFLPMAGTENPVDSSTGILADFGLFGRLLETVQGSASYDGLMLYLAHIGRNPVHWAGVAPAILAARSRRPDMPMVVSMVAQDEPRAALKALGIPVFEDPAQAVSLLGLLARLPPPPSGPVPLPPADAKGQLTAPSGDLNEAEGLAFLAEAGLRVPRGALVSSADDAVAEARRIGGRVAVKVASPDILHKSDVGGVRLDVVPEAAGEAFRAVTEVARAALPGARIDGASLAEMLEPGPELILGSVTDSAFGPVIMLGVGGVQAELYRDVVFRVAPVDADEALRMLDALRGRAILAGFRGQAPADRARLADAIVRVSRLVSAHADRGLAIEINPLRIVAGQPVCLDAVVTVAKVGQRLPA